MLSASLRTQRARIAAFAQHAAGKTNTGPALAAFNARFREQVIEKAAENGEELTEAEIVRRAEAARNLHFARLSFAASKARTAKATRRRSAEAAG